MLTVNLSPFPKLQTERLTLRQMVPTDAPAILFLRSNDFTMRHIGKEKASSIKDAEDFIQVITQTLQHNQGITWAICEKNTDELIGYIGFWRIIPEHHRAEVGYMLHPDHWRQNLMSEALAKIIPYGFNQLQLHSIEANADPQNTASVRLLTKHGFKQEGYFRENYLVRDQFQDTVSFSLLKHEAITAT